MHQSELFFLTIACDSIWMNHILLKHPPIHKCFSQGSPKKQSQQGLYIQREKFILSIRILQLWKLAISKSERLGWQARDPGKSCSLSLKGVC